jgi:MIP family channel proteins
MKRELIKACVAEFVGTFALIFIGIGAIANLGGDHAGLVGIALAHGLTIAVMVSATAAISGGHLNPAVTFGLLVGGKICASRALAYWVSQLLGAIVAAGIMLNVTSLKVVDAGTPDIGPHVTVATAILLEAVLTFFLVFVVYGSAVDQRGPKIGGLAIGMAVTLDILVGGPITGASMNPARTFGPAFVSGHWSNHIVYWIGPLIGGLLAGVIYGRFLIRPETRIETPATIAASSRPTAAAVPVK